MSREDRVTQVKRDWRRSQCRRERSERYPLGKMQCSGWVVLNRTCSALIEVVNVADLVADWCEVEWEGLGQGRKRQSGKVRWTRSSMRSIPYAQRVRKARVWRSEVLQRQQSYGDEESVGEGRRRMGELRWAAVAAPWHLCAAIWPSAAEHRSLLEAACHLPGSRSGSPQHCPHPRCPSPIKTAYYLLRYGSLLFISRVMTCRP